MKTTNTITAVGAGSPSVGFPRTMSSNVHTSKYFPELLGKQSVTPKTKSNASNK